MIGKCKMCGWQAGIFNLVNGVCKSCSGKNVDITDSRAQKNKTHYISATSNNMPNSLFSGVGRFNRSSFLAVHFVLVLIDVVLGGIIAAIVDEGGSDWAVFLFMLFFIPLLVLQFKTWIKRWHDLNKSGWMALTLFIPFIGILIFLYLGFAPGTKGSNKYGEEPQ